MYIYIALVISLFDVSACTSVRQLPANFNTLIGRGSLEKWEGTAKKGHFPQWAVYVCILPLHPPPPFPVYKWMLRTVLLSIFEYFGEVTDVLNIATNVNNWHYLVSKSGTLPRKKGHISLFLKK